jgi:hypothetical protein
MTLGSHQRCVGKSQVHLTPRWVIGDLGPFDLDPCAATERPWDCARENYTEADDGLSKNWRGMVWLSLFAEASAGLRPSREPGPGAHGRVRDRRVLRDRQARSGRSPQTLARGADL